ncbi:MAG: aldo/keto reductase [Deferribacteraceae bacterium]|jgi:predicted aldo/keto reductase-like oxidoreductase|nr:aldo/keto reductase [Deferribacteraceae bacterium]
MLYRQFGKTGETVSILGFGCMRLPLIEGGDATQIDEVRAIPLVRHAIDNGVNYLDTAYPYHSVMSAEGVLGAGASEPFVGKVLKDGYREKVKIATKLFAKLINTRSDMDRMLDEQLKRLDVSQIDFYLIHNIQEAVWPMLKNEGMTDFLDQALKDGRIKHAGFSFHDTPALFREVVDYYDWSFCQIMYNYLDENFQAGTSGLDYAAAKGLGIAIMEPLRGGLLAKNLPEEAQAALDATGIKRNPADWALRWVWNNPKVSVVLSGMNEMAQLEENLTLASTVQPNAMSAAELGAIDEVKAVFKAKAKVGCTQCHYCACPVGVDIPTCFSIYNKHYLYNLGEASKRTYYAMLSAVNRRASACLECGACESACPQQLAIRDELKNVAALFEGE